jgi:hypothetical protein
MHGRELTVGPPEASSSPGRSFFNFPSSKISGMSPTGTFPGIRLSPIVLSRTMFELEDDLVTGRPRERKPFPMLMSVPGLIINGDGVFDVDA